MTTHIVCVLDKSGSMGPLQREVISGFNAFLAEQKKSSADDALMTILLFDTEVTCPVSGEKVEKVADLDESRYRPSGCTALNDAFARAIRETEGRLNGNGDRALVLVVTDGQENSSRETTKQQIVDLIKQMEGRGNWTFTYMSAHPDGFADAASYGLPATNAAVFTNDAAGTKSAFSRMGAATMGLRSSNLASSANFYSGRQFDPDGNDPKRQPRAKPSTPATVTGTESSWVQ